MSRRASLVAVVFVGVVIAACTSDAPIVLDELGGTTTSEQFSDSEATGSEAMVLADVFGDPISGLREEQLSAFVSGKALFNTTWTQSDGLGPLFNAESCAACHPSTGRRQVPPQGELVEPGLVVRLSLPSQDPVTGAPTPEPAYGDQLQDRAIGGGEPEGSIFTNYITQSDSYADGTVYDILWPTVNIRNRNHGPLSPGFRSSARIGSQLVGMGYLELVPEEQILALADPGDADGDGISGRPNAVWNPQTERIELGRFGWKANVVKLDQQVAQAFHGDLGLTSSLIPFDNCAEQQRACKDLLGAKTELEVSDAQLMELTNYMRTLAVPPPRTAESDEALAGQEHFREFGCTACHVESLTTGPSSIEALSEKQIAAYTDLLLHDLGFDMSDSRADFAASPTEWRTAPLWGLGLVPVEGDRGLLHDGRARTIEEAILWHGGEARGSRTAFINAELAKRQELLAFLESL